MQLCSFVPSSATVRVGCLWAVMVAASGCGTVENNANNCYAIGVEGACLGAPPADAGGPPADASADADPGDAGSDAGADARPIPAGPA
ncbi:MAG: hypothetical protein MJD61_15210 [Proteobacteria bacterium]|nr:hypothetical protein [Pseudomonadota bacterium]